jgi:aminopeptidase N
MNLRRRVPKLLPALLFMWLMGYAAPIHAQEPHTTPFLAEHYDVTAYIDVAGQSLTATAKVDFKAQEVSSNLRIELHPNLELREVKSAAGKTLSFQRDGTNPLFITVQLPSQAATGSTVSLSFSYAGLLANEENSPVPGVRVASINKDGAYLLLPARWFPLTNYPSNRYTGTFKLNVPDTFAVAGTGKALAPTSLAPRAPAEGNRVVYTFQCDHAAPNGSFVVGNLQLNPKQAEGINVSVYAPKAASGDAQAFADDVGRTVTFFSDLAGSLPDPRMTVVQIPDGTLRDFAGPGLLLLSRRIWNAKQSERAISGLVAAQWWGNEILPASPSDVWITDGLARYSEALYSEQTFGKEAGLRAVDEFAVGALMYEDAAPLSQAARLTPYTGDYRSVVLNKGAMLFHMVRAQMTDAAFKTLLHNFYVKYGGKSARNQDFEEMAIEQMKQSLKPGQPEPNLRGFFAQWMNSTGVPEFTLEYVTYRTPKGFRVVGKIKQPLDTFHMPVQLQIDTEGNPELKTIDVVGTESEFTVETFGRPKPSGIKIDPNNLILKGSTPLRARAAIARGEELAELGRYYDAVGQYQRALSIQPNRALANFRMGEAFFYQKNYQAGANAFREALQTVPEPAEKWTEVWSHIYLGKIFDLLGQRERAVNEYSKAKQTNDDTGGAQTVANNLIRNAYTEGGVQAASPSTNSTPTSSIAPPASGEKPVLKKRTEP